jgi:hypothetical protein
LRRETQGLFASQVVLDEIAFGEPAVVRRRLDLMAGITVLDPTPAAEALADCILRSGLRRLVDTEGFSLPEIYTPEELSGE